MSRLVCEITFPLGKRIIILKIKMWWNEMAIHILLFGNNSHILIGAQKILLKKPYIIYI
jgi:hypothetical protein